MSENSHGKVRPSLPRLRDVKTVDAAPKRMGERDANGRFVPGNKAGTGRGYKMAIAKSLDAPVDDPTAVMLVRRANSIYTSTLRTLPSDDPMTRSLTSLFAWEATMAAHCAARAWEVGIDSPAGMKLQEQATKHGQRAERLTVTILDVSSKLASTARPSPVSWPCAPRYTSDEPTDDATPTSESCREQEASCAGENEAEHDGAHDATEYEHEGAPASSLQTRAPMSGNSAVPLGNLGQTRNLNFSQPLRDDPQDEFPEELFAGIEGEAADAKEVRRRQDNARRAASVALGPRVIADATKGPSAEARKRFEEMQRRVRAQQKALKNERQ